MVSMNPLNNYRGQVAVFYALLVPVFLFLGGVGLDLGWYYLNVSRLQNAADAAVLVGANKLIEEHDTFKNKNYKARLVDKFPADNPARDSDSNLIDTTAGDEASLDYAKKNLADNSTAYAPPNFFSVAQAAEYQFKDGYTRGNPTVTLTPSLYKDDEDNYYYVLHLTENIHHFFIGFLDDMEAPVVAVALLSKNIDDSDDPPDGDLNPKKIILDANGGTLTDENYTQEQTQRNIGVTVNEEDKTKYNDTKLPSERNIELKRSEYTFIGWNTKADGTGTFYGDGNTFTSDDLKSLHWNNNGEVVLYAQWTYKPDVNIEDISIFGSMKGYKDKDGTIVRRGLEELMTYRTWKAARDKGGWFVNSNIVFSGADSAGDKTGYYDSTKGFNIETKDVTPRSHNWDYTAFFDLSSDIVYTSKKSGTINFPDGTSRSRSGWGGLFKYTLNDEDYQIDSDDFNLFNIIKPLVNDFGTGNGNLDEKDYTLTFRIAKGQNVDADSKSNNDSRIKTLRYRTHNTFNIKKAWNKRTGNSFNVSSAYTAHVTGTATEPNVKSLIQKLIKELQTEQTEYGASTKLSNLSWDDIKDSIDKSSVSILKKYKDYAAEEINTYKDNNPAKTLTNLYNDSGTIATNVYNKLLADAKENDPLYVRIESEELNENDKEHENTLVRQIFLNVDSNYNATNGRPMVIFYEGPDRALSEQYDQADLSGQAANPKARYPYLTARNSQPLVLILHNDFKGIIFAPNSPVAIVGNGHKLEGFVVAEKFVKLLTSPTNTYTKKATQNGVDIYVDKWGNVGVEEIQLGDTNYMRRPEGIEIPYNAYINDNRLSEQYIDFNSYINGKYKDYTDIEVNNLKHYEWVIDANATFGLSSASHYDDFNIPELYRGVYTSLNPHESKDMFFTTARSKWIT